VDGRTRNRQQRRDRVYESAIELFVEQGYDNTTMEDIADRAGVARATVFNHFERKAAFLDEWASRRRRSARVSLIEQGIDADVRERLARYLAELASISTDNRGETVAVLGAATHSMNIYTNPALAGELADYLAEAQDRGQIRPEVQPHQAGSLLAAGYFLALNRWINDEPEPFELHDELLAMLDLVICGVLVDRGR
jgi:AcrR family transcriptional regulator